MLEVLGAGPLARLGGGMMRATAGKLAFVLALGCSFLGDAGQDGHCAQAGNACPAGTVCSRCTLADDGCVAASVAASLPPDCVVEAATTGTSTTVAGETSVMTTSSSTAASPPTSSDGATTEGTTATTSSSTTIGETSTTIGETSTTTSETSTSTSTSDTSTPDTSSGSASTEPIPMCGNGVREADEVCDGPDLAGKECTDYPTIYGGGTLACNESCTAYSFEDCCKRVGIDCSQNSQCCSGSCKLGLPNKCG